MQLLNDLGLPYLYSTKTQIDSSEIQGKYRFGALSKNAMISLIKERQITHILDVAHPFAEELHNTVAEASLVCNIPVFRIERKYPERKNHSLVIYCKDYEEVLKRLNENKEKTLFALSGVQSIPKLKTYWKTNKTYFRILNRKSSIYFALYHNFPKEQLILGLPNKDLETEAKLYQEKNIDIVFTKESGDSGSLSVKIDACLQLGIPILILKKPELPQRTQVLKSWEELKQVLTFNEELKIKNYLKESTKGPIKRRFHYRNLCNSICKSRITGFGYSKKSRTSFRTITGR